MILSRLSHRLLLQAQHARVWMSTNVPFLLADIGEGIKEVEILKWHVQPGDTIQQFDHVVDVQSDKASVEITSRYNGVVTKLNDQPIVQVGEPLLYLDTKDPVSENASASETKPDEGYEANGSSSNKNSSFSHTRAELSTIPPQQEPTSATLGSEGEGVVNNPALMSPSVRKLVKEHQIDLRTLTATGPHGRILKADVLAYLDKKQPQKAPLEPKLSTPTSTIPTLSQPAADETMELRGYGRAMFHVMTQALEKPHMVLVDELEIHNKKQLLPRILKCLSVSLLEIPVLNAHAQQETLTIKGSHDFGIAVAKPNGLVVPVIRNVQAKSIGELQSELRALKEQDSYESSQLEGATFTVSNIGSMGAGLYATPVLAGNSVGMVVLGRLQTLPRYNAENDLVPVHVMGVSYAGDHRYTDGATLARLHTTMARLLSHPEELVTRLR